MEGSKARTSWTALWRRFCVSWACWRNSDRVEVTGGDAGDDQLFMGHGGAGGGQRGNGGFRNVHLGVERAEADEGGAHQQADRGDQRDEQKAAENQPLIKAQHEREENEKS